MRFKEGHNGYPVDDGIAFRWVRVEASVYAHVPAMELYIRWANDPAFCTTGAAYCMRLSYDVNHALLALAQSGNLAAIDAVSTCVQNADDYPARPLAIYFWLNERRKLGLPVQQGALEDADAAISIERPNIRKIADDWSTSAEGIKEVLDDWDLARDGTPFTTLEDMECQLP